MYLGKICEVGTPDQLYATPAHPYTAALLRSIPVPDPTVPPVHSGLLTGDLPSPIDPPAGCRFRTRCPLAQERCAMEEPEVRQVGEGHFVACHFPLLGPNAAEATPVEVGTAAP
jgi:peptide/nickel transport system ATP-binding protein